MLNLNIKINEKMEKVEIREEVLFNTILYDHLNTVRSLIKLISPTYKIDNNRFTIINKYIEFDNNLVSVYPGLIVRTRLNTYAVLYLENTVVNEEYMISIIKEYIHDTTENLPKLVNIDKFEVTKSDFLNIVKSIKE